MSASYLLLDCVPTPEGRVRVIDIHGSFGRSVPGIVAAHGARDAARRFLPLMSRLKELSGDRRVLIVVDSFNERQPFPDDFFNWVQRLGVFGPLTDWVPDVEAAVRGRGNFHRAPTLDELAALLDPLARHLGLKLAYCEGMRIDEMRSNGSGAPALLLSGCCKRARQRRRSVVIDPAEVGVALFCGASERLPDDLERQEWFPVINPPLLDAMLECKWLAPELLRGTRAARLLPRWIPVGMGLSTSGDVMEFAQSVSAPEEFPLVVLKPSRLSLSPGVRFLDRTALRALASRQPERRLPERAVREAMFPRVVHTYEEIARYRGKLLDNLLRTPGAEVRDHGDGTFHFSAPYPFLETTVGVLQEHVEGRPLKSKRTGKLHHGTVHAAFFEGKLVAGVQRLHPEPDDGTFHDPTRPNSGALLEPLPAELETEMAESLAPFAEELEHQFRERIKSERDLAQVREQWVRAHAGE